MKKFYDYAPDKPFMVLDERHYIDGGEVFLDYTPEQGTLKISTTDGKEFLSVPTKPNAGEFCIDYAVSSQYKLATQKVTFNPADNGKKVVCDYMGVSTLLKARHMNEIKDFMDEYHEKRAVSLVEGEEKPIQKETVEKFSEPHLVERVDIPVVTVDGTVLKVNSVAGVNVGWEYTLADKNNCEIVKVKSVNSKTNIIKLYEVYNTYSDAHLYRTTTANVNGKEVTEVDSVKITWKPNIVWQGQESDNTGAVTFEEEKSDNVKSKSGNLILGDEPVMAYFPFAKYCKKGSPKETEIGSPVGTTFNSYIDVKEGWLADKAPSAGMEREVNELMSLGITKEDEVITIPRLYFNYSTTSDKKKVLYCSPSPRPGYQLHPAFIKKGGTIVKKIKYTFTPTNTTYNNYTGKGDSFNVTYYQLQLLLVLTRIFQHPMLTILNVLVPNRVFPVADLVNEDGSTDETGNAMYYYPCINGRYSSVPFKLDAYFQAKKTNLSYLTFDPEKMTIEGVGNNGGTNAFLGNNPSGRHYSGGMVKPFTVDGLGQRYFPTENGMAITCINTEEVMK